MMLINNALRAGTLVNQVTQLPPPWQTALHPPHIANALERVINHVEKRLAENAVIYPATPFHALQRLLPARVRVVILGQDPYHGPGQAQGLAFSVPDHCKRPPSLRNIFLEMAQSLADTPLPTANDLSPWAEQGVLLLNTVLTVEAGQAASHAKCGWETVTDALIGLVAHDPSPKVFMLWGAHAQAKQALFPPKHGHLILTANHPSPLSARRPPVPFLGCGHFVIANQWLKNQGLSPIQWRLEQKLIPTQHEFTV